MPAFVPMTAVPVIVAAIFVPARVSIVPVVVVMVWRGNRCTHSTTDGATDNRLVAPAKLAADHRTDSRAQARTNGGACPIFVRLCRYRSQQQQEGNQGFTEHGGSLCFWGDSASVSRRQAEPKVNRHRAKETWVTYGAATVKDCRVAIGPVRLPLDPRNRRRV